MYHSLIIVQIGEVPVEKSDIFIQHLQDNVPVGVSVEMELVRKTNYPSLSYCGLLVDQLIFLLQHFVPSGQAWLLCYVRVMPCLQSASESIHSAHFLCPFFA